MLAQDHEEGKERTVKNGWKGVNGCAKRNVRVVLHDKISLRWRPKIARMQCFRDDKPAHSLSFS